MRCDLSAYFVLIPTILQIVFWYMTLSEIISRILKEALHHYNHDHCRMEILAIIPFPRYNYAVIMFLCCQNSCKCIYQHNWFQC